MSGKFGDRDVVKWTADEQQRQLGVVLPFAEVIFFDMQEFMQSPESRVLTLPPITPVDMIACIAMAKGRYSHVHCKSSNITNHQPKFSAVTVDGGIPVWNTEISIELSCRAFDLVAATKVIVMTSKPIRQGTVDCFMIHTDDGHKPTSHKLTPIPTQEGIEFTYLPVIPAISAPYTRFSLEIALHGLSEEEARFNFVSCKTELDVIDLDIDLRENFISTPVIWKASNDVYLLSHKGSIGELPVGKKEAITPLNAKEQQLLLDSEISVDLPRR